MQDWKNAGPSTCLTIVMIIKLINTFHVMTRSPTPSVSRLLNIITEKLENLSSDPGFITTGKSSNPKRRHLRTAAFQYVQVCRS